MQSFQQVGLSPNLIFDALDEPVQVTDAQDNLVYVNQVWQKTLDYSPHEKLNFVRDVLHADYREQWHAARQTLSAQHPRTEVAIVIESRTGLPLKLNARLILGHVHDTQYYTCIFYDNPQQALSVTELGQMFNMSVDMLGIASFDGVFQKLNPAWERTLGYKINEMVGQRFLSFVHPDDYEETVAVAQQALTSDGINTFENRYRHKDGEYRWLSWRYISYPETQQTFFVARDITEQHQARNQLREARDQLQAILDNSGTVIGLKDIVGRYILVNKEFALRFGNGDTSTIVGKTDYDLFSQANAADIAQHDEKVWIAATAMQFEESLPGEEGMHTYLTTRFTLNDEYDNPYAICMIGKDITYRKLTEMQLLLRNQAIEYSPSGISIADARLPDMPLIYINPAFERTTGYSALDVIGRNCRFLQGDDRDQSEIQQIRDALKAEESVSVVLRNYRKDGELFYNELNLAPIHNEENVLTHYVGISSDVTDRVLIEERNQAQNKALIQANRDLAMARQAAEEAAQRIQEQNEELKVANQNLARARKEAEDATRLKSQFLATMSHELRTPLNAIIGYTEIQLAGMTGELNEEQSDYQQRVLANADHLLNLINDVLDLSKIEAGRMEMVHKSYNLKQWVKDIVAQMSVLAEEKGLELQVTHDERMPDVIVGDPARIKQIAINLISNGIKFTKEGYIRMAIRKHGRDAWKLIIEDTGMGIPSHLQETIFEEFRQVDSSSQREQGGTGLGLSIVRKLVLMMGGTIRLNSQLGEGSTFTIILPLAEPKVLNQQA